MVGSQSPAPPSSQEVKSYGITKPISVAEPTEADFQRNRDLEKVIFFFCVLLFWNILRFNLFFLDFDFFFVCWKFLVDSGLYASEEEDAKKKEVIGRLDQVTYLLI